MKTGYGPLNGIRVVDFTHAMAGPTCALMLADMGAEVIKIERAPFEADEARNASDPYSINGVSATYMILNRNKRTLPLNLKSPQGIEVAKKVLLDADVILENFRPGVLERLGLGYKTICQFNPQIIYGAISGFGRTGPYKERAGFDLIAQGMSGIMSVTGEGPGRSPVKPGVPLTDITAGILLAMGICAALRHREVSGEGQHIDIGMLDTMTATLSIMGLNYLSTGKTPKRLGNAHPNIVPYQSFTTADGNMVLAAANDAQYQRFCTFAGVAELAEDERFKTNELRVRNREELIELLQSIIEAKTSKHWVEGLEKVNVTCGPINTIEQVFDHPQVQARGMDLKMPHPATGDNPVHLIASPIRMSKTGPDYRHAPPLLGQHTEEVLGELLEMDPDEVAGLRQRGIV